MTKYEHYKLTKLVKPLLPPQRKIKKKKKTTKIKKKYNLIPHSKIPNYLTWH